MSVSRVNETTFNTNNEEETDDKAVSAYSLDYDEEESNETSVSRVNESLITTFNTNNEEEIDDKAMSAYSLDYGEEESNEMSVSRVNESLITTFNTNNEKRQTTKLCLHIQ
ncbi:hypothetical protein F8M41_017666 [Gigaspora margarita]|uniref:Uncharacterized protein n=1 Tax=Gigaspora margarita TaxID=4874 RepID=A0A8H4AMR6_GIGMA|nr:hypothetical protein F8M41_017666 [Gigaspora margarita]